MEAVITKSHHITYNTYFGPMDARLKEVALEVERKFILGETDPEPEVKLRQTIRKIFLKLFGRYPATHELNQLTQAYETVFPSIKESNVPNSDKGYIAVFNINPQGALVARLVPITSYEMNLTETGVLENSRRKKILMVQNRLPDGHWVVGVSNLLPSSYGAGGAYIFPVRVTPPAPPKPQIEIGPHAKKIEDLIPPSQSSPSEAWRSESEGEGFYS